MVGCEDIASHYGTAGFGDDHPYIDNTSIFMIMASASSVPEPATAAPLALCGLPALRRRCQRLTSR